MLVWFAVVSVTEVAVWLCLYGKTPWSGLVDYPSWRGPVAACLIFLLITAVKAGMFGSLAVALSLAVFHGCMRAGAGRWATLGVVVMGVLLSGLILWLWVTANDHGDFESMSLRVASAVPMMAATVATSLAVNVRERRALVAPRA